MAFQARNQRLLCNQQGVKTSMKIFTLIFSLVLVMLSTGAIAQNTMFLRDSPIAHLNEQDRQILRQTLNELIESPDGTVMDWSNPDTDSKGRVKVLDTHEDLGTVCRSLRARNEARGRKADGTYRLCKAEDGSWKFAAPLSASDKASNTENREADQTETQSKGSTD
jgi:surface antigen